MKKTYVVEAYSGEKFAKAKTRKVANDLVKASIEKMPDMAFTVRDYWVSDEVYAENFPDKD